MTARFGSDVMVDAIKACGFEYVALNPGSSYRGLHDSLVNYGGNEPQIITCNHEKLAVGIAHGEHVRVMTKVVVVDADEAEDEARRTLVTVGIAERDEAAVVHDGQEQLRRDYDVAAPHLLLDRHRGGAGSDIARSLDPERHRCEVSRGPLPSRRHARQYRIPQESLLVRGPRPEVARRDRER